MHDMSKNNPKDKATLINHLSDYESFEHYLPIKGEKKRELMMTGYEHFFLH